MGWDACGFCTGLITEGGVAPATRLSSLYYSTALRIIPCHAAITSILLLFFFHSFLVIGYGVGISTA